jgi:hypothetical protein
MKRLALLPRRGAAIVAVTIGTTALLSGIASAQSEPTDPTGTEDTVPVVTVDEPPVDLYDPYLPQYTEGGEVLTPTGDPYDPYGPVEDGEVPVLNPTGDPYDAYDPYDADNVPVSGINPYGANCAGGPTIALDSSTEVQGGEVVVTITCFAGGKTAALTMYSTPTSLGELLVGADGIGTKTFTIPCSIPVGAHTIEAAGLDANGKAAKVSAALSISAGVCGTNAPAPSPRGGNTLARTGATIGGLLLFGSLLFLAGYFAIKRSERSAVG